MDSWIQWIGAAAGIVMPFFNMPLILHLVKRKSSDDISITWVLGVMFCTILMTPQALKSQDIAFRAFGIVNIFFFSIVTFFVLKYRSTSNSSVRK